MQTRVSLLALAIMFFACDRSSSSSSQASASSASPMPAPRASSPGVVVVASNIANGNDLWIASNEADLLLNARVNIGTMHSDVRDDEVVVEIEWPSSPGFLNDWRRAHHDVTMPDGTTSIDTEHVVCRAEGPLSFVVASRFVAPDGHEITRDTFDVATKRAAAEKSDANVRLLLNGASSGYGRDPRSLACLAAAGKCGGSSFAWPPPKNTAPLEDSDRAAKIASAFNAQFVPHCRL